MTREPLRGSETSSGEERSDDPRDSEGPEESKTTRGPSETPSGARRNAPRNSERGAERSANGERSDPRGSESSDGETTDRDDFYREVRTDGGDDDIPLNIAGHEERERPGSDSSSGAPGGREETVLEFAESDDETAESEADTDTGDEDEEVEPVELLVQLAEEGEIDPWDIDIVRVTDRFLEALDDADLRTSGRALFYASVLLRMKSDALFASDEPDEEEELPPWEAPFADDAGGSMDGGDNEDGHPPGFDPVENLEAEMERRLERKHARGKPETLDELVRELRSAERDSWWKESRSYDTSDSPSGYGRGMQELNYHTEDQFRVDDEPTSDDVTHTTHEEDIETVIDDVETALEEHYENGRDEVLYAEIDDSGGSRVMTYLALLFLSHRGRIRLEQDELFGDLWIQRPTLEAEAEEAIAD